MASTEIPKFRYVQDVTNFVNKLSDEVNELGQLSNKQQKVLGYLLKPKTSTVERINKLNSALEVFNIGEMSPSDQRKHKKVMRKTMDSTLDKVVVPNLKELKSQYGVTQALYDKYKTLESVEVTLDMQFADARDLERAKGGIIKLKAEIKKQLKECLEFLNSVAQSHVPDSFVQYVKALQSEVSEHVYFEKDELFLYVHISEGGAIVFTYYIMLENAVNEEGEIAPTLYVAIQWNQGAYAKSEEVAYVRVFLDHEFELPQRLAKRSDGQDVSSVGDAIKTLATMLDVENFNSSLGVIPLTLQLKVDPKALSSDMFSYRDYISKVAVDPDKQSIIFIVRSNVGATKESVASIGRQLFLEVKELLNKPKGARLRMTINKINQSYKIEIVVSNLADAGSINQYEAEALREKFGLNENQMKRIVQILSQGDTR